MKRRILALIAAALMLVMTFSVSALAVFAEEAPSTAATETVTETPTEATTEGATEAATEKNEGSAIKLDPMNSEALTKSLEFLWKGLLAIFIVIIIIIIVVKVIQTVIIKISTPPKDEE